MTELSPAAQSVLDAATVPTGDFCLENVNEIAAAALRAAADQVVPANGSRKNNEIRAELRAIADELSSCALRNDGACTATN